MAQKVMLEVTQSLVNGNEVTVHAGELFDPGAKLPEGVTVRPVMADVPGKPASREKPAAPDAMADPDGKPAAEEKPAAPEPAKKTTAK